MNKKSSHTNPNNYDFFRACFSFMKEVKFTQKIVQYTYVIIKFIKKKYNQKMYEKLLSFMEF